ncbi:MAG: hypothetical protein RMM08_10505 [Armatimonadota bacterium]|nr:hypothetical protein [bacterium]MDW8321783.1 hypothetical protein [Armatimonadota bacterium]
MKHGLAPEQIVGWQGVSLRVPPDWSVTGFQGDAKEGYLRVDSPGSLVAEVRWAQAKKAVDVRKRLDAYLNLVERQAKKRKVPFTGRIKPSEDWQGALEFNYRADRKVRGFIRQCPQCRRVVIAQVSGDKDDAVVNVANLLLDTLQDHSEDGWWTWALLGLVVRLPERFALVKSQVMSGYLMLQFRNRYTEVTVERWGLADVTLKKWTLAEWAQQVAGWKRTRAQHTEGEVKMHPSVWSVGVRRAPTVWLRRKVERWILRRPEELRGAVWHCEPGNRIYAVRVERGTEQLLEQIVASVQCH